MHEQLLIVLQGVPGSGKSTLARKLQGAFSCGLACAVCSTDDYFVDCNGDYVFLPSEIGEAHAWNQAAAYSLLNSGYTVIVDNTNIQAWEAKPYVKMAQELNVRVLFIRCIGTFENTHGVPEDKVIAMRANMEHLTVETCLAAKAPWEK